MSDWRTRLKAVIEEKKISLPNLANKANYDYVTLWKALIKERHVIKRTTMNRICQVLEVDPDYIWYGHEGAPDRHDVPILEDSQVLQWVEGKKVKHSQDRIGTAYRIMSDKAFAWRSTAVDMQGLVALDSMVYFNPDLVPENMEYVLALYRGNILFRQYVEVADQQYLMPHNTAFQAATMGTGDRVLAVAVSACFSLVKDHRLVNFTSFEKFDDIQPDKLSSGTENN
ncbi:helix-turn-helix transcriptional regulator [Endozoicomonas gorgoniicola]|uniref:Helix-turn-helix transcriptional regulator n=1 Tax=Endozoicomonas gorgoniicola TaxID=1234144 RepID=A0ABT3MRW1_9GAMM|nr:helix-turn-helix transcriptional regulator [Endozoicomonas gorgoniicola]MCW7552109.1 helix-turn-helix transcriptional regulator [Endozoicomonas gorgoniicola]